MSNQDGHRAIGRRLPMMSGGQSKDALDLGLVSALNARCLEIMVQLARSEQPVLPAAISSNLALWRGLDAAARERAARHPVLLLDVNFSDATWWRRALQQGSVAPDTGVARYLLPTVASELMRETITLAWIIARADQDVATIVCGMAPPVARMFSAFGPVDVERLSTGRHQHLRLRFDDHPSYWKMHLKIFGRVLSADVPSLGASMKADHQRALSDQLA